jgi:subtilisin family serine protease
VLQADLMRSLAAVFAAVALIGLWSAPAYADGIRDAEWPLGALHVADAQAKTRGGGVVVAVVDTGVDATHPDLTASVLAPVGATATATATDETGHGTALAGLIAGQGHAGGDGVLGLAPDARVLPVVITSPTGDELAQGVDLAVRQGAKVICVGYSVDGTDKLRASIGAAVRAGAIVVAADGNRAGETPPPFPAAYDGVLDAVPLTRTGAVPVASTSGRRLGLGVPGEDIMTTNAGGGYRVDAGSAAPGILAGAVALVWSAYPDQPADEIIHRLSTTAVDAGATGLDGEYGQGKLDLVAALTRPVTPLHPRPTPNASPSRSSAPPAAGAVTRVAPRGPGGWLLVVPLLAVLGVLAAIAVRAERRTPPVALEEFDNPGLNPKVSRSKG